MALKPACFCIPPPCPIRPCPSSVWDSLAVSKGDAVALSQRKLSSPRLTLGGTASFHLFLYCCFPCSCQALSPARTPAMLSSAALGCANSNLDCRNLLLALSFSSQSLPCRFLKGIFLILTYQHINIRHIISIH